MSTHRWRIEGHARGLGSEPRLDGAPRRERPEEEPPTSSWPTEPSATSRPKFCNDCVRVFASSQLGGICQEQHFTTYSFRIVTPEFNGPPLLVGACEPRGALLMTEHVATEHVALAVCHVTWAAPHASAARPWVRICRWQPWHEATARRCGRHW